MASDTASCLQTPKGRNLDTVSLVLPVQPPRLLAAFLGRIPHWGLKATTAAPVNTPSFVKVRKQQGTPDQDSQTKKKKKIPLYLINPVHIRVPWGQGSIMCRLAYTSAKCSLAPTPLSPLPCSLNEHISRTDMSTEKSNNYQKKGN